MTNFKKNADAWLEKNNGLTTLIFLGIVIAPIIWVIASSEEPVPQNKPDIRSQTITSSEKEIVALLDHHGEVISSNSETRAIIYKESFRVSESEAPAYKSIFKTSHEAFMSRPNADKDKSAYLYNAGRTEIWQTIFCKPEVYSVMRNYNLTVISANLENEKGEMQSMAVCVSVK